MYQLIAYDLSITRINVRQLGNTKLDRTSAMCNNIGRTLDPELLITRLQSLLRTLTYVSAQYHHNMAPPSSKTMSQKRPSGSKPKQVLAQADESGEEFDFQGVEAHPADNKTNETHTTSKTSKTSKALDIALAFTIKDDRRVCGWCG